MHAVHGRSCHTIYEAHRQRIRGQGGFSPPDLLSLGMSFLSLHLCPENLIALPLFPVGSSTTILWLGNIPIFQSYHNITLIPARILNTEIPYLGIILMYLSNL